MEERAIMFGFENELMFMNDFARAYERRFRDYKKRNHCLSIEYRYQPPSQWENSEKRIESRYGEDAMFYAMRSWREIYSAPCRNAIRVSFGIGAKSQAEYEAKLQAAIHQIGLKQLHENTDKGLLLWLAAMREMAGDDFSLLFAPL